MRTAWIIFCLVLVCMLSAFAKYGFSEEDVSGHILATVNGKMIYKKDVEAAMPKDAFGPMLKNMRKSKLDSLIFIAVMQQFLAREKIAIDDKRIDDQIAYLRKYPPSSSGCSCCSYASLEQYMQLNNYTLPDLRDEIRVNMGLEFYINKLWRQKYATEESRHALVAENRERFSAKYINVSHIFFNVFQDPQYSVNSEKTFQKKMGMALAAIKRLNAGEHFELLAQTLSEDTVSRHKGGMLGCIRKRLFGVEFSEVAAKLSPGEYSRPVASIWGVHIIKRNKMTDADILVFLKGQFHAKQRIMLTTELIDAANVVRYDNTSNTNTK